MNRHEGVSCDSCLKNNFRGRRYKCLICIDYDLCAICYESGATTNQHTTDHPVQCILTHSDYELYYGGEALGSEQPQAYTCPFCYKMGFTDTQLMEHVSAEHADTQLSVVCPVCASMPGGEPNLVTDDFAGHLTLEHRTGPRDLISFVDEPSGIRHGGARRVPQSRGVTRSRRTNMTFSTGLSSLSPSSRDAVVDPIAELLSQLSGVRRGGTPSQLQQLQMQLQLERQQVTAARQQLERLPRRPTASNSNSAAPAAPAAAPPAPTVAAPPAPAAESGDSHFLLSSTLGAVESAPQEAECRAALLRGIVLASLGRPAPPTPVRPRPPPAALAAAPPPPATVPRAKPPPRTKEPATRAHTTAPRLPEGR